MSKTCLIGGLFLAGSLALAQGNWSEIAPTPTPVEGAAIGQVGDSIISAYGDANGDSNQTRIYNIRANTWYFGAPAPGGGRAELAYGDGSHGEFVYVTGGRDDASGLPASNELDRYSLATNTWAVLTPMPTPRAAAMIASVGNALYVIGGRISANGPCSDQPLTVVERYDIAKDTWTTVAPLPVPRSDAAVAAIGDKIYVIGGCQAPYFTGPDAFTNTVFIYNVAKNVWTMGSPMPTPRGTLTAANIGNRIYAVAGWNGGPSLTVNEVYDVAHDSWSEATPILVGRGESNSISHGGGIYVIAGSDPGFGASIADSEVFKP